MHFILSYYLMFGLAITRRNKELKYIGKLVNYDEDLSPGFI